MLDHLNAKGTTMPATRRLLLAAPALLALPARAAIPELVLWGPPAGPTVTLAAAVQNGFLDGVATRLSVRVWRDPDELRAGLASAGIQASVVPTVVAANLYNRGLDMRLLNVMTDGLLAIVAAEPLLDLRALRGRTVALPFVNDTPDFAFRRIARAEGLDPGRDLRIQPAGTPAEAAQLVIAGRVDAAVLAEPATTAALLGAARAGRTLVRAYDLQAGFGRHFGMESLPQAGLALRDTLRAAHPEAADALQAGLVRAAAFVRANPATAGQGAASLLGLPAPVIEQSIPHSRLVAHRAREARPALEAYFRMVMEADPALIGGRMPPEDFFL
jgi:NitT/TauT family transport system substrate-binding protein